MKQKTQEGLISIVLIILTIIIEILRRNKKESEISLTDISFFVKFLTWFNINIYK